MKYENIKSVSYRAKYVNSLKERIRGNTIIPLRSTTLRFSISRFFKEYYAKLVVIIQEGLYCMDSLHVTLVVIKDACTPVSKIKKKKIRLSSISKKKGGTR